MGFLLSPAMRWLVALLVAASLFFLGYLKGASEEREEITEEMLEATQEARRIEQRRATIQQEITDAKDAEIRRIRSRLDDALERLRNRPERLPEASRPACQGSTGRELSGRDAAFLERLAARADELRAALQACQEREHRQ